MQAIETSYRGYRMRSRLEARWAVFFDALGVTWEYEKQGYHLASGLYLPDFWLPSMNLWGEVKPTRDDFDWHLAYQLDRATDRAVVALIGVPEKRAYRGTRTYVSFAAAHPLAHRHLESAIAAARAARFEHGESGVPHIATAVAGALEQLLPDQDRPLATVAPIEPLCAHCQASFRIANSVFCEACRYEIHGGHFADHPTCSPS